MEPKAVDIHVGERVRQRRTLLGMSQTKLGTAVGLTFQQIQKYERGANRMGSSRLFEFAKILDVPVSYFFDEMAANTKTGRPKAGRARKGQAAAAPEQSAPLFKREALELVRAYHKIRETRARTAIAKLIDSLAETAQVKQKKRA